MNAGWLLALLLNPEASAPLNNPCETSAAAKFGNTLTIAGLVFKPGDFVSAIEGLDQFNQQRVITLRFSRAGNKKFVRLQQGKVGRTMPICLGKSLVTNPILNEVILGGEVQLSGNIYGALVERIGSYINSNRRSSPAK